MSRADKQRKFFVTSIRSKKGNIRFAKPSNEDREAFLSKDGFNLPDSAIAKYEKVKGNLMFITVLAMRYREYENRSNKLVIHTRYISTKTDNKSYDEMHSFDTYI